MLMNQNRPPHREIWVEGVHAYGDKRVCPGETCCVRVSSTVPYDFSIVQLGPDPDSTEGDVVLCQTHGSARPQAIHPGSYVTVPKGVEVLKGLTVETWFRPFDVHTKQGLLTQVSEGGNNEFAVYIEGESINFVTGQHEQVSPAGSFNRCQWHHLAVTWDRQCKNIWLDGVKVSSAVFEAGLEELQGEIRLAASMVDGKSDCFFDGDLSHTVLYERVLTDSEIVGHKNARGLVKPSEKGLLAYWSYSEEKGPVLSDSSGCERNGQIINNGTWMIGGPSFDEKLPSRRFDRAYDPSQDPTRGHALRFASDDLYDCRWPIVHQFEVPAQAKQGLYVARFEFELDGAKKVYDNTFVVRRPSQNHKKAPVLVLCSTNSWQAYNSFPFTPNVGEGLVDWHPSALEKKAHPDHPGFSMYCDHKAGQPAYQVGMNMPWPCAGPYKTYYENCPTFSQWARNERFFHLWLEHNNYEYDVLADLDLEHEPELLEGYDTVCLVGHSEYWSEKGYLAVQKYLDDGGNLTVLSGNSVFWRVSYDEDHQVMECRKYPQALVGSAYSEIGQLYHSHDGKRGGLLRYCELPAWQLIGLETFGWKSGSDQFKSYTVDHPEHFLFNTPHKTELAQGELMGEPNEELGFLGAVGHEYDVRLSTLQTLTPSEKLPPHFENLQEPTGMVSLARCYDSTRGGVDYVGAKGPEQLGPSNVISEIVFWQRRGGGKVFNIGSVAAPWAVYKDKNISLLMKNVLCHFGVKASRESC